MEKLVVIGAGMASGRLLEHLFESDPSAYDVTLFNAEPRGNYNRIMLSPVLSGEKSYEEIVTHDDDWYAENNVTCRFGERVQRIDRDRKVVIGEQGEVAYDKLVIATGSDPFIIPCDGHDLDGVIAYRDLEDTNRMIDTAPGQRALVIGGGLLGLEAAAGLRLRGLDVTVLHLAGHLMERQLDPAAGYLLRADLERRGITVMTEASTKCIRGEGSVEAVELQDGTVLPADLVVMAVGIRPAATLAKENGLTVNRAIEVDAQMRTSDPSIFAVGECIEFAGQLFGLVAPLYDQAKVLAATLLGEDAAFAPKQLSTKLIEAVSQKTTFQPGSGLPGGVWVAKRPILMRDLGTRYGFLRAETAGQAGLKRGLGLPVPVPGGDMFVVTLLSAEATPLARRFEIWDARAARTSTRETARLIDGICDRDGPLWDPENAGNERTATIWEGPIGRVLGTGVPVAETGAAAMGYAMMVALPIHRNGELAHIVAWYC